MFHFMRPVGMLVFWACLWTGLVAGVEVLTNLQTGLAVNKMKSLTGAAAPADNSLFHWLLTPGAASLRLTVSMLLGLVLCMLVLRYLKEVANARMSMEMVFYIREGVYDKLQRVGFAFHDSITSGQLINRALSDLQNVRAFVQTAVIVTLDIVLAVAFNIILIWTRSPWVAWLSLVPLPIWTFYILRFSRKIQPVARTVMEADDRNVSIITEAISGVHVIKAFATEQQEVNRYIAHCDTFKGRVLGRIRMFANFQPIIRSIAMAALVSMFLVAGIEMIRGHLLAGDLLILGGAMGSILGRLQQVSTINEQYQNAIVSARRLHEVLTAEQTIPENPHASELPAGDGEVVFDDVTFGYAADKPVLRNISFTVKGGSIVAIVGPTGAGKTSLVNLLARFYDPQSGNIRVDGMNLRDTTLTSLRTQVAFVFQETYLFSDTVAANIAYGRPDISRAKIEAAAKAAQADEFIQQFPNKYDTVLAERGASLSGGQKQRLAIARAILTDPRILILDDATAAVDPETEGLIRRGMKQVMHGRTTFVIAHRISTVKQADLVIVLEHGQVTQAGTHAELMAQDGHYRQIAEVQLYGDEEPPGSESNPSHMKRLQSQRPTVTGPRDPVEIGASDKV
jgi:ABC-type multidrug transport system fused ATPase/permease subunit